MISNLTIFFFILLIILIFYLVLFGVDTNCFCYAPNFWQNCINNTHPGSLKCQNRIRNYNFVMSKIKLSYSNLLSIELPSRILPFDSLNLPYLGFKNKKFQTCLQNKMAQLNKYRFSIDQCSKISELKEKQECLKNAKLFKLNHDNIKCIDN
jgi:hypothetical protein